MIQNNGENPIVLGQKGERNSKDDWLLSIGRVGSENEKSVKLDSASPHVLFVCGARGSGKSYTLGVLAEEISQKNSDIAAVIIDPIGIFWSMKYPNQEDEELELLKKWDMKTEGMENVNVLVPTGYTKNVPPETFDNSFSFQPNSLTTDDWCLTFGIDRYNPQGLLLERAIEKVKTGFTRRLGDKEGGGSRDVQPNRNFSIEDLVECINHDKELLSKKKGFKGSTRRALTSRLNTAKDWGIFGREKKLSDIIRRGNISVFDISFLPQNIGSLVLGMLARKILSARKAAAREEAIKDLRGKKGERTESIPPTWLMIDEAHSFAPSSGKTAATDPLVEYVKQGRRPGLSAVLSTQQPSALNSKIISQLDILLSHRLSFENDIKEVWKRMPTSLPNEVKDPDSLKKLPEGTAIAADKEVSQAFFVSIRPRKSQHEGRERVVESSGEVEMEEVDSVEDKFESYDVETEEEVERKKVESGEEEILAVPFIVSLDEATEIAESERDFKLKFFWPSEHVKRISKHYYPIWSFLVDYYPRSGKVMNLRVQIDGLSGELIKKGVGKLERTNGVRILSNLSSFERDVFFKILGEHPISYDSLGNVFDDLSRIKSAISTLLDKGLVKSFDKEEGIFIGLGSEIDIPSRLSQRPLLAAEDIPTTESKKISDDEKKKKIIDGEKALEILETFGDIEMIEEELFYYPYWIAELVNDKESRILAIDGVLGNRDEYVERMFRRRVY